MAERPTSEAIREIVEGLQEALDHEREAAAEYAASADKSMEPTVRAMFRMLSNFELEHAQYLEVLRDSLERRGEWVAEGLGLLDRFLTEPAADDAKPQRREEEEFSTELSILQAALETETEGQRLYRRLANRTTDERGKAIFHHLEIEEEGHLWMLRSRDALLRVWRELAREARGEG